MVGQTIRNWQVKALDPRKGSIGYWCECTCAAKTERWVSKYNLLHGKSIGCRKCGKHNRANILTEKQVETIRELATMGVDKKYIAKEFKVSLNTVDAIAHGVYARKTYEQLIGEPNNEPTTQI